MSEQLVEIIRSPVREAAFGQAPHRFVRTELGRIGRKVLEVQARELAAELAGGIAPMNSAPVPEHDDMAAQLAQQVAEELEHLRVLKFFLRRKCQ